MLTTCMKLNVPELYEDPAFSAWLKDGAARVGGLNLATWHDPSLEVNEFSDVFVTYDNREGSDSPLGNGGYPNGLGMPVHCWDKLCEMVEEALPAKADGTRYALLWLTNL